MKRNDLVLIAKGKDRAKTGKIEKIFPGLAKATIGGINIYKKHLKPSRKNPHGGIIDITRPIAIANLRIICPRCNKLTKEKFMIKNKSKSRVCQKCGEALDV